MIKYIKSTVVRIRSAVVSRFCVTPISKKWFLSDHVTIIQVNMKHDPSDAV
jgi:hypothetical protein